METWETLTMSRKEVPRAGLLTAAFAAGSAMPKAP
jgi:hypothetical protein